MKRIIDISYYQDPSRIDYDALSRQVDGVIIRAGYGTRKDTAFDTHYEEFKKRGVPVGCYHFMVEYKSVDEQLAVLKRTLDDSRKIIDLGNGYGMVTEGFELGIWADVELESGATPLTRSTVIEYMTKAEAMFGVQLGIYTGAWCWNPIMGNDNPYSSRRLWVGSYSSSPYLPIGWDDWFIWQYTSSGRLDGYPSNLDMNRITDENWEILVGDDVPDNIMPIEIPQFSQKDAQWASDKLGTSSVTIGAYGCLITAASMICKYFGKNTDPGKINKDLIAVDGYESGNLLKYNAITTIYPDIVVDWNYFLSNPGDAVIDEILVQEIPVIAQVDYNPNTSALDQHWVVIVGKENDEYLIVDPIDGSTAYLSRYANKVYRMVVYKFDEVEEPLFKAKCIVGALNVRVGPSTAFPKVDLLLNGDIVNVYEEDSNWFRIGKDRWCSGYPQYMEKIDLEPQPPEYTDKEKLDILWEWYENSQP